MTNIKIIGTTHLMPREEIIKIIKSEQPDIIGVELCETRLNLMVLNQVKVEEHKEDNSILGKISRAIKKKAEEQKVEYGSDQITASKFALENNIPLALLDKDIMDIQYLFGLIPIKEQQGFATELAEFENQQLTSYVDEEKTLKDLKTKYPVAFEFLVSMRDLHIVYEILRITNQHPDKKLLVFLGKGHLKEVTRLLKEKEFKFLGEKPK